MDNRIVTLVSVSFLLLGSLSGCASAPVTTVAPETTLGEARAAVSDAKAAGYSVDDAQHFLKKADQAAAAGNDKAVASLAEEAKHSIEARKAIDEARPVVDNAVKVAGILASDASKLLDAAEAALKAGDPVRAQELAAQARNQAEKAMEESKAEARHALERSAPYQVIRGDSLWSVAGKPQVYDNAFYWPLLYRANTKQIKDPDLIFPGQKLTVDREATAVQKSTAARHAAKRGAWKLGKREPSDRIYLAR